MSRSFDIHNPPLGLGLTSLVLGTVGLGLFLLPVLGIPLAAVGLAFGVAGLLVAMAGGPSSLRWSIAGAALCLAALAADIAIATAPQGYILQPVPRSWQSAPVRPYVSPPARPGA